MTGIRRQQKWEGSRDVTYFLSCCAGVYGKLESVSRNRYAVSREKMEMPADDKLN